ncbi:MAG: Rho termination factor N-terminal domain-containing protein [Bacilli bacterium]|nr:Rho termination factor N-terminal domain-containing protein [Bacilli bacterium]MDD4282281.1 Rho termination factor N-terminal domain-containing protein [Bacilli bacterium]MDD4718427.1 Rho termination factor N-terminal domain-containing protein [Bacilli bacterium]
MSKLTVVELRELAKEKAISGYSTMKKAELIDVLK